jgi:hypothetical protein
MRAGVTGLPVSRRFGYYYLGRSSSLSVYNWPQTNSGQGPATGLNTPPSGRKGCYSSLPSKHEHTEMPPRGVGRGVPEGFRVPPIPATPGRTGPTPSASRSVGAELTGVAISILGIRFTSFASVNVVTLAALGCATGFIGTPDPPKCKSKTPIPDNGAHDFNHYARYRGSLASAAAGNRP